MTSPPDPAKYMPVTAVQEVLQDRRATQDALSEGRAQEKVNAAVRQGYITNGMKDWALALCRSDEPSFDQFLASTGPSFAYLTRPAGIAGSPTGRAARDVQFEADAEAAICAQLGLKPGALTKV